MQKFIVLSDLHLVPAGKLSHAIDTYARLEMAIDHVNRLHSDAAFAVFAGDLTDHGDVASFERLKSALSDLSVPAVLTLGNHDDRENFLSVFPELVNEDTGRIDAARDLGEYRVIVLDSLVSGETEGRLTDDQIAWLTSELAGATDRPVIIVLHHNIAELGVPTDFICLKDTQPFLDAVKVHGDVRMVIYGHVHMSTAGTLLGVPFTTISGLHYNIFSNLEGPLNDVPRREGPGQVGVVLAGPESVVVHHENAFDRHQDLPAPLFYWDLGDD